MVWCSARVEEPGLWGGTPREDAFCRDREAEEARYVWSMLVLLMIIGCCCCLPLLAMASHRRSREMEQERREEMMMHQMFLAQQQRRAAEHARLQRMHAWGHRGAGGHEATGTPMSPVAMDEVEGLTSMEEYAHLRRPPPPKAEPQAQAQAAAVDEAAADNGVTGAGEGAGAANGPHAEGGDVDKGPHGA